MTVIAASPARPPRHRRIALSASLLALVCAGCNRTAGDPNAWANESAAANVEAEAYLANTMADVEAMEYRAKLEAMVNEASAFDNQSVANTADLPPPAADLAQYAAEPVPAPPPPPETPVAGPAEQAAPPPSGEQLKAADDAVAAAMRKRRER